MADANIHGHFCPTSFTSSNLLTKGKKVLHFCPESFALDLGEALRAARKAIGLTQAEAGSRGGVSRQIINGLEAGRGSVRNFTVVADAIELRIAGLPSGKTIGERIKLARIRRGWTQATLANRAELSIPSIRAIERDTGQMSSLQAVMSVIAPAVRTRKPERANWTAGNRDRRYTPSWLLDEITSVYGRINLDPCHGEGALVQADRYITAEENALISSWSGRLAFMNPPFSKASAFLERAYRAWADGECETVIALVPVRTSTRTFHTRCAGLANIVLLQGRPKFINPEIAHDTGQAPFGLMLVIWGGRDGEAQNLSKCLGGRLISRDNINPPIPPHENSLQL